MNLKRIGIISLISLGVWACATTTSVDDPIHKKSNDQKLIKIPPSPQRIGDAEKGKKYLLEGDYLDSGIPAELMSQMGIAPKMDNYLNRSGENANLPPQFTYTQAANGVDIIAPNCLVCHGAFFEDDFIVGLGNYDFDGTIKSDFALNSLSFLVQKEYGESSDEWIAFEQFYKATSALNGNILTKSVGANSADKITQVLLAHRNMEDMTWSDTAFLPIDEFTVPADPPAWWLLKKKNAQFTTGIGRGDFARISTASSLLTMKDISKVQEIDNKFADIIAFIFSLEPPKYPREVDAALAAQGSLLFKENCSKCHGTYGEKPSYPNYLVHQDVIKTDPMLTESYHVRKDFVDLYNNSWFGQGEHAAHIIPANGYVAPPLDGVWATAPYLHNGSVPTIEAVINSAIRPTYWKRESSPKAYDYESLGWKHEVKDKKIGKYTYDTTLEGYGNTGHYFGDKLNDEDRKAVLEYLKTI